MNKPRAPVASLEPLLNPRTVAIIGASQDESRIGGMPIRYMQHYAYSGEIFPINPKHRKIQGLNAYARIGDIGKQIDVAIMAVPAKIAIEIAEECAAAGVKSICAFTSGFAEMGEHGKDKQNRLRAISENYGMRILGPNCLGYFNTNSRYYATFSTSILHGEPQIGNIGLVSQSGAFGSHCFVLGRERGLGFTYMITTGNEVDVDVADCIAYLAQHHETKVIAVYMEGCQDGERLKAALGMAFEASKPVVIQKVGRTDLGAKAALSHTASLAGVDEVYDAVFAEFNVHRVNTAAELIDVAYLLSFGTWPAGNKLAVATISGGAGVLMADAAADAGLNMPKMPKVTQERLKKIIPFAGPQNPVDFTAQVYNEFPTITKYVRAIFEEGGYDSVIAFFSSLLYSDLLTAKIIEALLPVRREFPDRLFILCAMGPAKNRRKIEECNIPVLEDPTSAVNAIAAVSAIGKGFVSKKTKSAIKVIATTLPKGRINEVAAKLIFEQLGIGSPKEVLVNTKAGAISAARDIDKPVALKIVSTDILHKSDIGGVELGVSGAEMVGDAFEKIMDNSKAAVPKATIDGVLISEMVDEGVETILGIQNDPLFGPVVMFGLGGLFAEAIGDIAFKLAPLDEATAMEMVKKIRGFQVLSGARGTTPVDLQALAKAIAKLSNYAYAHKDVLQTIEINPLRVLKKGLLALDAVIISRHANKASSSQQ